jgi:DNA-directed RNA polymerase II subunit RPB1
MFDGDEMNMFIPQSVQTQLELANIADVKRQIITPRYSRPIIKFKQDTVLGTYKMTEGFKKLNFRDAMNLSMYCNGVDMFKVKKTDTNTHDLYSLIIPQNINFTAGDVVVNNGKIVDSEKTKTKGVMGDSILNQKIVYYSWDRHGPDQTKNFFDNAQRLVTNWLLMNGFTVGLGDATTDQAVIDDIKSFCEIKQMEVDKLITEMENNPDTLDPETFESNILSTLKASDGEITKRVFEHLKKNQKYNNFFVMIESKAKGSQGNIGQIIGGLGQNVLEFRRIKKKVNNRTLPHFFQNDDRAFARGFIPNSYYHGLTPKEFFFHHMTAREGMIDTAIKTADSGYLQRKLIKGMEDVMMTYDKTVRSGNNVLMQMIYGDNGINQTHYKEIELRLVNMGNTEIEKTFCFSNVKKQNETVTEVEKMCEEFKLTKTDFNAFNSDLKDLMIKMRDELRTIQMKARMNYITMQSAYQLPVNMNRIVEDAKNFAFNGKSEQPSPLYIMHAIHFILRPDITKINIINKDSNKNKIKYGDQDRAKFLFKVALLEYLNPRRCIYEYGLSKIQFDQMVVEIVKSFRKACVEPGEMVGVLTAQSLGETLTQMTLNTFHSTGVGVKGMQGIPRFREILSYSKKIQTPYMIIKMVPEVRAEQNIAHKIEAYLKHTIFGNLIERMDIVYDPNPKNTIVHDKINTSNIYYVNGGSVGLDNLPWLYKFTISREAMLENDISLLDIKTKFIKYWEEYQNDSSATKKKIILSRVNNGCIMSNFDNSEPPVVHIRFDINNPDNYTLVEIGQFMLNKISIKGVATIEKVDRVDKQKVIEYDSDGAIKPISNEWVIYTTGIDLNKIKTIKHIDFESVYLNDIYMTYLNFGVEAARNLILRETDNLYNGSGNPLNVTHLALLADVMTNTGNITSIDRHGINRLDTDPLSRASFEKTVEQLIMASAFNEVDYMRSVSSRIMAGRCIKGGTGICEVMLDNDIIENSEYGNQASYISTGGTSLELNSQIEEIGKMINNKLEEVDHVDMFIP